MIDHADYGLWGNTDGAYTFTEVMFVVQDAIDYVMSLSAENSLQQLAWLQGQFTVEELQDYWLWEECPKYSLY